MCRQHGPFRSLRSTPPLSFLVGLMAGRIAERKRIGEELRESRESFADLHTLHERIVESVDSTDHDRS